MSSSRHIDKLCVLAAILALMLAVLFMNGRALGIEPLTDGDAGDGPFTGNDLDGDWDASGAGKILLTGDGAEIRGGGAYVLDGDVHIASAGRYVLTGDLTDGCVVVDAGSGDKIWLLLDGVTIHCEDGAALLVEQAEKVFVTLAAGTENDLSSGGTYSEAAAEAGVDGTVYARDDLTINGAGSLVVTAAYRHGIVCNDDFVMTGGTVTVDAARDGIHANDSARFRGMSLTITAGDDGVTVSNDAATAYFYMESGRLAIPACYEGVEAIDVTVAGGALDITPTDDGLNANGNGAIRISGGEIRIVNETGRDADGLDSNGSIFVTGGSTFVSVAGSGGSCAIDYGSENGGRCEISGGTVIACGGAMMAEGFDASSEQGFVIYTTSTAPAGSALELRDSAGAALLSAEIPCAFSSAVLSAPGMKTGDTYTLSVAGQETEVTAGSSAGDLTASMFGGGMFGGGGRPPGGQGQNGGNPQGRPGMEGGTRNPPQAPEGDSVPPEMPDGGQFQGRTERPGFSGGTDGGGRWDGQQNGVPAGAAGQDAGAAVSPAALALTGLSVLVLLAGLALAWRVKGKW